VKFLEFSSNFEKSLKFWWGKGGRLSGLGVWPANPSMQGCLILLFLLKALPLKQTSSSFFNHFKLEQREIAIFFFFFGCAN
jgi:hypothetical protein